MKTIYIARLKEDKPQLVKSTFLQETKRAIYVQYGENEAIIGDESWFTVRAKRNDSAWFGTEQEALTWLEEQTTKLIERYNIKLQKARDYLQNIRERMEE